MAKWKNNLAYLRWQSTRAIRCTAWSSSAGPWPPNSGKRRCIKVDRAAASSSKCRRLRKIWRECEAGRSEGPRGKQAQVWRSAPCPLSCRLCTRSWRAEGTGKDKTKSRLIKTFFTCDFETLKRNEIELCNLCCQFKVSPTWWSFQLFASQVLKNVFSLTV